MGKSFTPVYIYPTKETGFFEGDVVGKKLIKRIKGVEHSAYGGWWPCFFPSTIGFLVTGTREKPNVMTVSGMAVVNAYPFMVGVPVFAEGESPRGDGRRYSFELLKAHPEFTLNVPYIDEEMSRKAIVCGSISGRSGVDKFARANFTTGPSCYVSAPILQECPLNLECRVYRDIPLGSHHWIIGQVDAVYLDKDIAGGEKQLLWRSMPEETPPPGQERRA